MKKTIQILDYDDDIIIEENSFTSRYEAVQSWVIDMVKVVLEWNALEKFHKKEWKELDNYLEQLLSRQWIAGTTYKII